MRHVPTTTPCKCGQPQCDGLRLRELHLYGHTEDDFDFLEMLKLLLDAHEADPTKVSIALATLRAQKAEALSERIDAKLERMADALRLAEAALNN